MPPKRKSPTGTPANCKITLYLSKEEKDHILDRAGTTTLSRYCVNSLLGKRQTLPKVPKLNRLAYLELGRIGNNLNQIARAIHQARRDGIPFPVDPQQLEAVSQSLVETRSQLMGGFATEWEEVEGDWEGC